ncbi:MAG: hypothetical protein HN731_00070 [Rhodospirillaceae bacterium]|nr:hypothetical protein [Rhodospirillaceae bacterium]
MFRFLSGLGGILLAVSLLVSPAIAEVNFAGKTVRILINFGVGSSTDVMTRQFAPFVGQYLPGNPTVIVEAKPGGRGTLGTAYMYKNVKPDGMTLGGLTIIVARMATAKVPVDITKFVQVGARGGAAVVYVRQDSGIKTASDLKSVSQKVIMGATTPRSPSVMQIRLFLNAFGQDKHKLIAGYKGQLGMLKAVRSGEVQMAFMNNGQWMARRDGFTKEGLVHGIMESGQNDASGKVVGSGVKLPTVDATWRKLLPDTIGSDGYKAFSFIQQTRALNYLYVLPPKTPVDYAKAWDKAMASAIKDPGYLALLDKNSAPHPAWTNRDTTTKTLMQIAAKKNDPAITAMIKKISGKK